MRKLVITPDADGYSVVLRDGVQGIALDGGASHYGMDLLGTTKPVRVQWTTGPQGYDYLTAFHRLVRQWGVEPFLIDLIVDGSGLKEYQAEFVPGSFHLVEQRGHTYVISAELEVMPRNDESEANDLNTVFVYSTIGMSSFLEAEDLLDQITNVDLPEALS
jgi:hypothetical protein